MTVTVGRSDLAWEASEVSSDGRREEKSSFGRRMFMERQQLEMGEPVSYRLETGSRQVSSDSQRKAGREAEVAGRKPAHSQVEHTCLTSSAPVVRTEWAA